VAHRTSGSTVTAHRGALLHFLSDPGSDDRADSFEYFADGLLLIRDGHVAAVGPASALLSTLSREIPVINHGDNLLLPGFIDTHIHYPQTDVIASAGRELLDWLEDYTFPAEQKFADAAHAQEVAEFFLDELARNGTTTAMVFCTVHRQSVDAFFTAAAQRRLRMIAGKVLMDRHCPEYLRDSASAGDVESRELLERWHDHERLGYAITPRFAATSTSAQLIAAGRLAQQFPNAYIHSHLAENRNEIAWVKQLFPEARSYLGVYDSVGLLRERATYAHCIYLDDEDRRRMAASGATAAFCPTSNLYLGSGLFDIAATDAAGMRFSIATDVGGGTSFSMLRTLGEAYKVSQMLGQRLSPLRAFYLATLGGARCLHLDHRIGSFSVGHEADFVVLDRHATPLLARRCAQARSLSETLLILMTLGDDRCIAATYAMGNEIHRNAAHTVNGPSMSIEPCG
jgi:guanine deaminase